MTLKQKIYDHYLHLINEKINLLQQALADLKESGTNETKSTAGDKHETALAMLQIEQANTRAQLKVAQDQKAALEKIAHLQSVHTIVNGSLVKTNLGYLFLSTALGKAVVTGHTIIALSPQSPLGMQLMGLQKGATVIINSKQYLVETVE